MSVQSNDSRFHVPKKPLLFFLQSMSLLLFVNLALELVHSDSLMKTWNWVFPVLQLFLAGWTSFRMLRTEALLLWTPIPWFLAAVAIYNSLGSLIFTFGSQESIDYISVLWSVSTEDLWYTHMLNLVGTVFLTLGLLVGILFVPKLRARKPAMRISTNRAKQILLIFLSIGLPVRYLLALPYEFGLSTFVLPGAIFALREFVLVSILMLGFLSAREKGKWYLYLVILMGSEIFINLLLFSKLSLILVLLMAALGRFLGNRRFGGLVSFGLAIVLVYFYLNPVFNEARILLYQYTGRVSQGTFNERVVVLDKALKNTFVNNSSHKSHLSQSWWIRFSMNNVQSFAMNQYDAGLPGDSLKMAIYTFIPRILWEDKPIITNVGIEFSDLALGLRTTSTGIGIFGEAYWNGGWLHVLWTSLLVGLILSLLAQVSLFTMSREEWIFLPCVFLGIKMGFRIDGWFAADYIGTFVFYVYFFAFLYIVNMFWNALQKKR